MRAWLVLIALTALAEAKRPAPRREPPFRRNCREGASWETVEACRARYAPAGIVHELGPGVKMVDVETEGQYLFARLGETWRIVYQLGDRDYELAGERAIVLGKQSAQRIDLAHHVVLGPTSVLMERVTLVCLAGMPICTAHVTACTVLERGRATETTRGELRYVDGAIGVDVDRRYAGTICATR